ncbi:MAG: hypothetical protein Q4A62_01925 [Eikenella sp.]|nr:hypothetical protein [Eikenella sp.]
MNDFLSRRQAAKARAASFWQAWQQAGVPWHALSAGELAGKGNRLLHRYFPDVSLQVAAEDGAGKAFQVALSSANKILPMADAVLLAEAAPQLPFELQALLRRRPAAGLAQRRSVFGGADVRGSRLQVACSAGEGGLLALAVWVENGLPTTHRGQHVAVWQLLADALGQWDLNVKVEGIELVAEVPGGAVPLPALPAAFDALWRDRLGRNGVYPWGKHDYSVYEGQRAGGLRPPVLLRNESAAALLGRADMAWCVSLGCEVYDDMSLGWASEIESAFAAALGREGQGIVTTAYTDLVEGVYQVCGMVSEPEAAVAAAEEIAGRYLRLNPRVACEFDPSWRHYRF